MSNNKGIFGNLCRTEETGWLVQAHLANPWAIAAKEDTNAHKNAFCRISLDISNFGGFMNRPISKRILKNCGYGCPFSRIHGVSVGITELFVNEHERGGDNHVGGYHS